MYGLAFLMGLVLGFAQWLVLRRYVRRAALWMPANALAWAFGMLAIFVGADPAVGSGFGVRSAAILAFTLALAGRWSAQHTASRSYVCCARGAWSGAMAKLMNFRELLLLRGWVNNGERVEQPPTYRWGLD